jgi:SAM-dependent methyltransferase
MNRQHYIIQGGIEGRERLRLLSRVMRASTLQLFDRVGLSPGAEILDVGCGGGDVTLELAQITGSQGSVVGTDIDSAKLDLARSEAVSQGIENVEFLCKDVSSHTEKMLFDVTYARFLLTHLVDPARALGAMFQTVRPGGVVILEDIDCQGFFCYPHSDAMWRYVDLYTTAVKKRGGDPNIGPRLPLMLRHAGFERIEMQVAQPAALEGEAKLINPVTLEFIKEAVLSEGLAEEEEIDRVTAELYAFANDPDTVVSCPRVIQTWGYRPASD